MHTFSRSEYATEEAMINVYRHVKPIVKIYTKYELGDSAEIATQTFKTYIQVKKFKGESTTLHSITK